MPHLNIEYSANLEEELDVQALVDRIHETALETGIFPLGGVRTRAEARGITGSRTAIRAPATST